VCPIGARVAPRGRVVRHGRPGHMTTASTLSQFAQGNKSDFIPVELDRYVFISVRKDAVWIGRDKRMNQQVLIRVIDRRSLAEKDLALLTGEVALLQKITHRKVARFREVFDNGPWMFFITDAPISKSVREFITERGPVKEKPAQEFLGETVEITDVLVQEVQVRFVLRIDSVFADDNSAIVQVYATANYSVFSSESDVQFRAPEVINGRAPSCTRDGRADAARRRISGRSSRCARANARACRSASGPPIGRCSRRTSSYGSGSGDHEPSADGGRLGVRALFVLEGIRVRVCAQAEGGVSRSGATRTCPGPQGRPWWARRDGNHKGGRTRAGTEGRGQGRRSRRRGDAPSPGDARMSAG